MDGGRERKCVHFVRLVRSSFMRKKVEEKSLTFLGPQKGWGGLLLGPTFRLLLLVLLQGHELNHSTRKKEKKKKRKKERKKEHELELREK